MSRRSPVVDPLVLGDARRRASSRRPSPKVRVSKAVIGHDRDVPLARNGCDALNPFYRRHPLRVTGDPRHLGIRRRERCGSPSERGLCFGVPHRRRGSCDRASRRDRSSSRTSRSSTSPRGNRLRRCAHPRLRQPGADSASDPAVITVFRPEVHHRHQGLNQSAVDREVLRWEEPLHLTPIRE